jgi:anti-sigma B factor antagonist
VPAEDQAPPSGFTVRVIARTDTTIVSVDGELDMLTSPTLERKLATAQEQAGSRVLIDLSAVGFVGSTGLSALVAAANRAEHTEGRLAIVANTEAALLPLRLTNLCERFALAANVDDGLRLLDRNIPENTAEPAS